MKHKTPVTIDYEVLANQIINEHNKVRTDPKSYIDKLNTCLKLFKGDILYRPGEDPVQTFEGKSAFEEAIVFLERQQPIPELSAHSGLSTACLDHTNDIGPKGLATHESSNGNNVSDRIEKYSEWDGACCESIEFGSKLAEDIIINFIVDDGISERLQRKNLFNPELKFIGVGVGPHKEYGHVTVVNYVSGVRAIGEPAPEVKTFIQDYCKKIEDRKNSGKPKNAFQEDDPDAPDNTVSVKIVKTNKVIKGKAKKITRKIYSLSDNTQHIVEIEDN